MKDFYADLKASNSRSNLAERSQLHPFMFSKSFVGIDFNIAGEAVLVCKAPSHVIKTQSEHPDFDIYAYFKDGRILSFMIKIYDLKKSPYTIVSHNVPAKKVRKIRKIRAIAFINESDEEILSVEITPCLVEQAAAHLPTKQLNQQSLLKIDIGTTCEKISSSKAMISNNHLVHRDTDQNPQHAYKLSEEISIYGENAIYGHGKRMEDQVHFHSISLSKVESLCGMQYVIDPVKSGKELGELCDELIIKKNDWALFIQEKSIITKLRFRETSTTSERLKTTIQRVKQASSQLKKHIDIVRKQGNHIVTEKGDVFIPDNIYGLIVVSETFHQREFFSAYIDILNSAPLFKEIKLNILSLGDYIWITKESGGDPDFLLRSLEKMYYENLDNNKFGNIPCYFSIACRLGEF